jgi:putative hydrolase of the HAD superfamily
VLNLSAVLFDMNDVLCGYDRKARIAALARTCGKTPAFVEAAIWSSGYEDCGDEGAMDADAYLVGFGDRLGYPLSLDDWIAAQKVAVTPFPDALAFASEIGHKVCVAVLTNNNMLTLRELDAFFPALRPIFDSRVFVSAQFATRKPDPEVYRRCLARLGVAPEATLFVDDSVANVAGAERAGLRGHVYANVAGLAQAVRGLGTASGAR